MKALAVVLLLVLPAAGNGEEAKGSAAPPTAATKGAAPQPATATVQPSASTAGKADSPAKEPAARIVTPPPKGSHLPADKNSCIACHGESDLWDEKSRQRFISKEKLAEDVHAQKGVNCHDCHGGNPGTDDVKAAHAQEDGFRAKPEEIKKYCAACHKEQLVELRKGVHDRAGAKDDRGSGTLMDCDKCHGTVSHHALPARDKRSPVFLDNQVQTCGGCHEKEMASYTKSVHGQGLYKLGLQITAACADCHGAHGIYRARDTRSTLHVTRVADTCGKCHRFIEERLQKSVHAHANKTGALAARDAPGGKEKQTPSCTACHQGHDLLNPESSEFRLTLPNRCGNCHAQLSQHYRMSVHGELTGLGYGPAAKCSDCHGAHDILAVNDPNSHLSPENREETCAKCHSHANANFASFDPHADYTDAQRDPVLHWVYRTLMTLLITTFCVFGVHSFLWFVRGLGDVLKHGRPRPLVPRTMAYVRFTPFHRVAHTFLLISFLGLALTGLPLKYSEHDWAQSVAFYLGGFPSTSVLHRFFAVVTFGCFVTYAFRLVQHFLNGNNNGTPRQWLLFGPDSPVPNLRDVKDFVKMLRWFFGLGPKPTFERWTYWEKFDFWGALADIVIIGSTGMVLWFPNLFTSFLPGSILNISKVIHSTQALLATGFVFAIHFFSTHFRAEKFPADLSILTGLVSEEEMQHERPEYLERMRREGKLEEMRAKVPPRRYIWLVMGLGFLALAAGLALLVGMILAGLGG